MRPFPLLILLSFTAIVACKKPSSGDCNLTPEHDLVTCNATSVDPSINGFTVNYYANGIDKESEGNYTDGVPTGFWKFYYPNGNIKREGNFTDGKADGFWNVFYENGNILSEGSFDDCVRQGFWKYYYESSKQAVQYEGHYEKNVKTGTWKEYKVDGSIDVEHDCE